MSAAATMTALVTGSTDGIGLHTARRLVAAGHSVILHGRDSGRLERAMSSVESHCVDGARVYGYVRDFKSLAECRALAEEVKRDFRGKDLSMLFNNAGVYMEEQQTSDDGHEMTFAVNVLAPYVLTEALLPTLVETAERTGVKSSVLNVASISASPRVDFENIRAEKRFSSHGSYSLSKACMKAFSYELFDRLVDGRILGGEADHERNLNVFSCDPGTVNTKMLLAGWGRCGIETYEANDQFDIMVRDIERNSRERNGYYFVGASPQPRRSQPGDDEQAKLWDLMERETGVVYA